MAARSWRCRHRSVAAADSWPRVGQWVWAIEMGAGTQLAGVVRASPVGDVRVHDADLGGGDAVRAGISAVDHEAMLAVHDHRTAAGCQTLDHLGWRREPDSRWLIVPPPSRHQEPAVPRRESIGAGGIVEPSARSASGRTVVRRPGHVRGSVRQAWRLERINWRNHRDTGGARR